MLSKKQIVYGVIGVCVIIIISFIIAEIIKASKKSEEKPVENIEKKYNDKIEKSIVAFNLSKTEPFADTIQIKTLNDIVKNFKFLCELMFPEIDYNEVNKLLKEFQVDLSASEIFEKHKNDSYTIQKYDLSELLGPYFNLIMYNTKFNIKEKILALKLIYICVWMTTFIFLYQIAKINEPQFVINNDYLTNDILTFYIRNDSNKSIANKDAIEMPEDAMIALKDTSGKLYKIIINLSMLKDILSKETIKDEMSQLTNKIFHLKFVRFLMTLENIPTTNIDIIIGVYDKMNPQPTMAATTPNMTTMAATMAATTPNMTTMAATMAATTPTIAQ
jgi:hypothetical protein